MSKILKKKIEAGYLSIILIATIFFVYPMVIADPTGWVDDVRLTNDPGWSYYPHIAVNGDNIHVVWSDKRDGDFEVYYKKSIDNGVTWSDEIMLTTDDGYSSSVRDISLNGDNIYVIWQDSRDGHEEIYYKFSTDNGETWSSDIRYTFEIQGSFWPKIEFDGNLIHFLWENNSYGSNEIFYANSDSASTTTIISPVDFNDSYFPAFDTNGEYIHVVWVDERNGYPDIYYRKGSGSGNVWSGDISFTSDTTTENPDIAVKEENIHVVWHGHTGSCFEVYYKRSTDNGETWSSNTILSENDIVPTPSYYPTIAVDGENIHVVWHDIVGFFEGADICYIKSSDNGLTWSSVTRLSQDDDELSIGPRIDVNGENIHVVWQDEKDGNAEIYYKRTVIEPEYVDATIDIKPNSLNLKSKGRWITCYIELPEGYDVADFDINTILLNDIVTAETHPTEIDDYDKDGIIDLMIKFDRQDVQSILSSGRNVEIRVLGELIDGTIFEGADYIKVI